jgi:hypothetical protein
VVRQTAEEQLAGLSPGQRAKEKLRHSLRLQVHFGGDLVSQIEEETRGRNTDGSFATAGNNVLASPGVNADALTPRLSPFAVFMSGKGRPQGVDSRARFWEIVSDHGWPDSKVADLRNSFLAYASKGKPGKTTLSFEGFEELLPLLLKIEKGDMLQARVRRYWTYLDIEQKGEVNFEDFFIWYLKYMPTELDRTMGSSTASSSLPTRRPSLPSEQKTRTPLHDRKLAALGESSVNKSLISRRTVDF